jgi:anthranilate synthase component 2
MKPICVIDNYESFTYNLVHILEAQGCTVEVFRNDQFELEQLDAYDKILLSPGPGIPDEAGLLKAVIRQYAPSKSILGICLGHQAIGEVFGGELINLDQVYHGVATPIVQHQEDVLFEQLSNTFEAGRYHSWVVAQPLPGDLVPLAYDEQHQLMALKHKTYEVRGVQFHPESILTPQGAQLIKNWATH